jgi:hypothetical protein
MTTHELSHFMWGKWLVSDDERNRTKESGYGIIGSSHNFNAESYYPGEVLIGRPFLEVYDINSYTLTREKDQGFLLWSSFYYRVTDSHWVKWKGESKDDSNRPFIMEHHTVIPKGVFNQLRFNLLQTLSSNANPQLDKIYFSDHQNLDNIIVELPSDDQISDSLRESLKSLDSKYEEAPLTLEILNNYSAQRDRLAIVNCTFSVEQRLRLFQNILILLPDKDASEFSFCTASYVKAKPLSFNVMILEPEVPVLSTMRQVDASRLSEKNDNSLDGYGSLLVKMINELGVDLTIRLMRFSTHRLMDNPQSAGVDDLKSLYFELLAQKRLDEGMNWSLNDLHNYIKKHRDQGVQKYHRYIDGLFHNNTEGFLTLLRTFPNELVQNGFREHLFAVLGKLSSHDTKFIFINSGLAGSLNQKELQSLSNWISEKFSGNIHRQLDVLVEADAISLKEKDDLVQLLLRNKFDPEIFMIEAEKFVNLEHIPPSVLYIDTKDIEADFIAKAYNCLTNNVSLTLTELTENSQYFRIHPEWFHKFVILALRHSKYDFLSDPILGMVYRNYWIRHGFEWEQILVFWRNSESPNRSLPLLSLAFLLNGFTEKEIAGAFTTDLKSAIDHLCQIAGYLVPEVDLRTKFWEAFRGMGTRNKFKDIELWLSRLLESTSLYPIGKYLLKTYVSLAGDDAEFMRSIKLLDLFRQRNIAVDEIAEFYLAFLPKKLNRSSFDERAGWLLHICDELTKNHNVNISIYSRLARRLEELQDPGMNALQSHRTVLAQLNLEQKMEYLKGVRSDIRARLDARDYLDSLSSITINEIDIVLDILKRLFESGAKPVELVTVFDRIRDLTIFSSQIRSTIIDKVGKLNIPNLPIYMYSVRVVSTGQNLLSKSNGFIDELFMSSLNAYQNREGSAEKLIKKFLEQDYQNISLLQSALERSLPHEKKMVSNLKKLKDYTAKIRNRPL